MADLIHHLRLRRVASTLRTRWHRASQQAYSRVKNGGDVRWREVPNWLPQQARDDNFRTLTAALDAGKVSWWVVSGLTPERHVVGVDRSDRVKVLQVIANTPDTAECLVCNPDHPDLQVLAAKAASVPRIAGSDVLQVATPTRCRGVEYGVFEGCELEFWAVGSLSVTAPRPNRASAALSVDEMKPVQVEIAGRPAVTPEVFTRRMVDDVSFDIDVVYTWVDSDDAGWRESRDRTLAQVTGTEYHAEATHPARFRSRDELRYSLRSLAMFAPWVRRVYLVTSGQVPHWLETAHPALEVVPHQAIYDDPAHLPTFNSNSIISRLHHIPGLSEHYLYLNDDVMLAKPVQPDHFFTPSGLAKVFPSNNRRPFGPPALNDEPHINLTRNIRALLERACGVTVSRAIWHTPHAQLRSLHFELEQRFAAEYRATWASRFRHHNDIVADQLHHYYAQIVGRAVVGRFSYQYINLLDDSYLTAMERLLRTRNRLTFCLNDAPAAEATPIPDPMIRDWLEAFFPIPSPFERDLA